MSGMQTCEFQTKKLLTGFGVPVQVHAGGRGKGAAGQRSRRATGSARHPFSRSPDTVVSPFAIPGAQRKQTLQADVLHV